MPIRPQNVNPQDWSSLVAAHVAAKAERERLEHARAGNVRSNEFSPALHEARIAELEAAAALEGGADAYNRVASDLVALRALLVSELRSARAALGAPPPAEPAPLAGHTPAEVMAFVAAVEAYRVAYAAHVAAVSPAMDRICLAWSTVAAAQSSILAARRKAGLPAPTRVVPDLGDYGRVQPTSVELIDQAIRMIERQGEPTTSGTASHLEHKLHELRRELAEWHEEQAAEREAARIEALNPSDRRREIERLRLAAE